MSLVRTKILHIILETSFSGAARVVIDVANEQKNHGFDVSICCHKSSQLWDKMEKEGFKVLEPRNLDDLMTFDVYYSHLSAAFNILSKMPKDRLKFSYIHLYGLRITYQNASEYSHLIAVSDAIREHCILDCGVDPDKVTTIHNGTRIPENIDFTDSSPLDIIFAGRRSYVKGFDIADKLIKDKHPDYRIHRISGKDDMDTVLQSADILLMPSRIEPFGLLAIEAMAHGCIVVASSVGGLAEILTVDTGVIVPEISVMSFHDCILTLLGDEKLRMSIKEKAYDRVKEQFDIRDTVIKLNRLQDSLNVVNLTTK